MIIDTEWMQMDGINNGCEWKWPQTRRQNRSDESEAPG